MTGDAYRFWVAECRMGGCEACEILHRAPITRGRLKDLASVQETLDNAAFHFFWREWIGRPELDHDSPLFHADIANRVGHWTAAPVENSADERLDRRGVPFLDIAAGDQPARLPPVDRTRLGRRTSAVLVQ